MNKVTKAEREALYRKARDLLSEGLSGKDAAARLVRENSISMERAQSAVAHARLRMNRPSRF